MALNPAEQRQQAHALLDQLPPAKLGAVRNLLEVLVDKGDALSDEDLRAINASREYFRQGGDGVSFEEMAVDLGFTMEQIRGSNGA